MLGASNIIIEIKNGGKTFIRVTDNGSGMELSDMQACIERHATSKIKKVEDLEKSYTMGFRGEALASIASISYFTIISKTQEGIANKICVLIFINYFLIISFIQLLFHILDRILLHL